MGFCAVYKHFSGFEFFLLPNRIHAHPRRRPRAEIVGKLRNINITIALILLHTIYVILFTAWCQYFDIFNGDADGICALIQLRLVNPVESQIITGVKRDIALLQKVKASSGDQVTVLDISLDCNRSDLDRLISVGAHITYFDHHYAGQVPQSSNLEALIDESPDTCTSLLVDRYLNGQCSLWAITAAFGDNSVQIAEQRCVMAWLNSIDTQKLRQLGENVPHTRGR